MRLVALFAALLFAGSASAQVEPPDNGDQVDTAREDRVADQFEQLRTDRRWVAFRAAWQRREETSTPRSLEPLLLLAKQAATAYNSILVGVEAERAAGIEVPPGLLVYEADPVTGAPHIEINWGDFQNLAQEHGREEDQAFFDVMPTIQISLTDHGPAPHCAPLSDELSVYSGWVNFSRTYPTAYRRSVSQILPLLVSRIAALTEVSDAPQDALNAIANFLEQSPTDPLASALYAKRQAIQSGRFPTAVECTPADVPASMLFLVP